MKNNKKNNKESCITFYQPENVKFIIKEEMFKNAKVLARRHKGEEIGIETLEELFFRYIVCREEVSCIIRPSASKKELDEKQEKFGCPTVLFAHLKAWVTLSQQTMDLFLDLTKDKPIEPQGLLKERSEIIEDHTDYVERMQELIGDSIRLFSFFEDA